MSGARTPLTGVMREPFTPPSVSGVPVHQGAPVAAGRQEPVQMDGHQESFP